jgi:NAD(P)H-flavin reductase/ferredoxin
MFGLLKRTAARPHRAHFERQDVTIEVAPDQTLLQAALDAGLPFPHNCRVGSCTTCKCRLLHGRVRSLTDTSYVLGADERDAGAILACQTRLLGDVRIEIEWPAAAVAPAIAGRIAAVRDLTPDIVEMRIELDQALAYSAGQYATIEVVALGISRDYSFAAAPQPLPQTDLVFYVRRTEHGSFTRWLGPGRAGEPVRVRGPFGAFTLSGASTPLIFVAGGSGLAPIKAMLEQALQQGCARDAVLLFGARTRRDLYALEQMQAIATGWRGRFRFVPVLSEEPAGGGWDGAVGLVTDGLAARVPDLCAREAYLCGPPAMVDAAEAALLAGGVRREAIRCDRFEPNGEPLPAARAQESARQTVLR